MRWLLGVLAGVLLVLYLLTGVVQVRPGERAVVRRFGRVLDEKPEPGLWVGLPWGMERVDRVEVDRVRNVSVTYVEEESGLPAGQLLTGDHNLVNVRVVLYYKVRPAEADEFVIQAGRVTTILERVLETTAAEWVAGRGVDEVLLVGKTALRGELIEQVQQRIEPYLLGVDVLDARVEQMAPPDEVKDAFDSVARAQTQIATLRYRAEQEAATRERLAEAERFRIDQSARAYAHEKKLLAGRDAKSFLGRLKQYRAARDRNPEYLRQIWQEERGKLFDRLNENGQLDLLDHHLNRGGLELFTAPGRSGKR
jgi:membrane protease subunit HflK